jgi:hypothetical protein
VEQWNAGQYGAMRAALNPAQLPKVPAKKFATCHREALANGGYDSVGYQDTVRVRTATRNVAGVRTPVYLVTADLSFSGHEPQLRRTTMAWYADGSHWRWIADRQALRGLRYGQC